MLLGMILTHQLKFATVFKSEQEEAFFEGSGEEG